MSRPSADDREQAHDLLPWLPVDDDGLAYRRDAIAHALAAARAEGYDAGRRAQQREMDR